MMEPRATELSKITAPPSVANGACSRFCRTRCYSLEWSCEPLFPLKRRVYGICFTFQRLIWSVKGFIDSSEKQRFSPPLTNIEVEKSIDGAVDRTSTERLSSAGYAGGQQLKFHKHNELV